MGWAIKRADGTYRGWNRNAKDDALQPDETWEELPVMPAITPPVLTDAEQDTLFRASFDSQRGLRALAIWTAQRLGVPLATAVEEIKAIARALA